MHYNRSTEKGHSPNRKASGKQANRKLKNADNMLKYLLCMLCMYAASCTDQGDPVKYALRNTSNFNIDVILYERFGNNDTTSIHKDNFKVLHEDVPPYDDGPFGIYDSIKINFEDLKTLSYIPPMYTSGCIDSVKNPFCPYTNYICSNSVCTIEIDSLEHQKAK